MLMREKSLSTETLFAGIARKSRAKRETTGKCMPNFWT
jgi:hypothetical protein